ncbi:MAG: restriction endonuclease subunit S [Nitrospira sp.]|nr:restriction endonuclease subunit S [Nitrospira sp.]
MNPARFLSHFDRISDAPDAIPRLRQFVLDLAVRGKLVEQDPRDEPASELLKRIEGDVRERKARGESTEPRNTMDVAINSLPFNVPPSWRWSRLVKIADVSYGFAFESSRFNSTKVGMPLIRIRDISWTDTQAYYQGEHDPAYVVSRGDYLVGMDGDFNVRKWNGPDALLNQRVMRIKNWRVALVAEFLAIPLQMILNHLHASTSQTTVKHLSAKQVNGIYLPVPPTAEQERIVAKVDELMALCDRLEAAQAERESWRNRLVASSLNRLNNGDDADAFHNHIRFYFNHLPRLTTKPEHIQQLRQTILNLAVRGKLVPQDPTDEPASELLRRIKTEIVRMVKEGKRKPGAALSPIDDAQAPFDLPHSWVWARFPELGIFGRGKSKHRPRNDRSLFSGGTHLLVQTGDVARSKGVIETYTSKYNDLGLAQSSKWPKGTLCITIAANIADSGILSFDACFPDSVVGFMPTSEFQSAKYFEYFVRTAKADLLAFAPATAQKNINLEILNSVLIPLPPLAEQQRIIAKVDELMALCDNLETQITTIHTDSRRLLEAVLHEAMATAV